MRFHTKYPTMSLQLHIQKKFECHLRLEIFEKGNAMQARQHLLIIDPQNDFCDLPQQYLPQVLNGKTVIPALPVAGAHADMQRVARLIETYGDQLSAITVTLDSHHRFDIAHPSFWRKADGTEVTPFTQISVEQFKAGEFVPRLASSTARVQTYLETLESAGRYRLMIWPVHCEIGSWGHNVHADVRAAYNRWEDQHHAVVEMVYKGSNPWTEHYSAMMAEVPDDQDPDTQLNQDLLNRLNSADRVFICGEASSHCVRASTEHIVAHWPKDRLSQLVLLTDCMSAVAGFEQAGQEFVEDMRRQGLSIMKSTELVNAN